MPFRNFNGIGFFNEENQKIEIAGHNVKFVLWFQEGELRIFLLILFNLIHCRIKTQILKNTAKG